VFFYGEVFLCKSFLIENSATDNKGNIGNICKSKSFEKGRLILFYIYYFFVLRSRITILVPFNFAKLQKVPSVDRIYKSASWLERETGEMFKVSYNRKVDTRRLLLDYSKFENPLLKDFSPVGANDLFYSLFEDQVIYTRPNIIEL
jgi:NADH:ubiquinone oxidoreductase subunit C